jgi:hypothetical protein
MLDAFPINSDQPHIPLPLHHVLHSSTTAANLAVACSLLTGVERSSAQGQELAWLGHQFEDIRVTLPVLDAVIRLIQTPNAELAAGPHIGRAIIPTAVVPNVFDALHGRELSLVQGGSGNFTR